MLKYQGLRVGFAAVAILLAGAYALPSVASAKADAKAEIPLFNLDMAAQPDVNKILPLKRIIDRGAKLYYMGERSQIHGWFIVKDGGIQMVYMSPDNKTVIVGGLISDDGINVTNEQAKRVVEANPNIKAEVSSDKQPKGRGVPSSLRDVSNRVVSEEIFTPTVRNSPGERLIQDLKAAAGVTMGKNETARLYMIVAPSCPVCKATWKELRTSISDGDLEVRIIPVYNNVGGKELNQAARLLTASNPLKTWDKFSAGDKSALAGKADKIAIRAVKSNLKLVTKWNIQGYPYLAYRGKDGRIKIVQGKPERMAAVLLDMKK